MVFLRRVYVSHPSPSTLVHLALVIISRKPNNLLSNMVWHIPQKITGSEKLMQTFKKEFLLEVTFPLLQWQ